MNALVRIGVAGVLASSVAALIAQAPVRNGGTQPVRPAAGPVRSATLAIEGQPDQAPLIHVNGRSYVDVESLARLTHAGVRYVGSQVVLTLPEGMQAAQAPSAAQKPQLSTAFLGAEIEALTAIREWRVTLVNAVQNNTPVSQNWLGPLRRFAESRLQLAAAAASTEPDQRTLELLRNEFAAMGQESDSILAMRATVSEIRPDTFDNNAQDQKILACERALAQMAATKEFRDEPACH